MWKISKKSERYWMVDMWKVSSNGHSFECLNCGEVEALGYFQLLDMKCDDMWWISTIVLHLYLIWTPAKILEHVLEFER